MVDIVDGPEQIKHFCITYTLTSRTNIKPITGVGFFFDEQSWIEYKDNPANKDTNTVIREVGRKILTIKEIHAIRFEIKNSF